MTKPVLLIQFRTDQVLEHEYSCVLGQTGLKSENLVAINVLNPRHPLPQPKDIKNYQAVILGGSGQFSLTESNSTINSRLQLLLPFLHQLIQTDHPTLGLCFGHQLLAYSLGSHIETNPDMAETGTLPITLSSHGQLSPLFDQLPPSFLVVLGHKDSVVKPAPSLEILATSANCPVQAFQVGNNIFGVQFHPELTLKDFLWRLKQYPEYDNKAPYVPTPQAPQVIKNFISLVYSN